jgi:hypothetical protein
VGAGAGEGQELAAPAAVQQGQGNELVWREGDHLEAQYMIHFHAGDDAKVGWTFIVQRCPTEDLK